MKNSTMQWGPRLIAAAAMMLGVTAAASAAHAFSYGPVTITGTRYVDGVPYKVRCTAAESNNIVYSGNDVGLNIIAGSACGIYSDTSDTDSFVFEGTTDYITKNGTPTDVYMTYGTQIDSGPFGGDPAHGTTSSFVKTLSNVPLSAKGTISYWRVNSINQHIVFIGKFKTGVLSSF